MQRRQAVRSIAATVLVACVIVALVFGLCWIDNRKVELLKHGYVWEECPVQQGDGLQETIRKNMDPVELNRWYPLFLDHVVKEENQLKTVVLQEGQLIRVPIRRKT